MNEIQRIQYVAMAMQMCNLQVDDRTADLILRIVECVDTHKGETSLLHVSKIKSQVDSTWKDMKFFALNHSLEDEDDEESLDECEGTQLPPVGDPARYDDDLDGDLKHSDFDEMEMNRKD